MLMLQPERKTDSRSAMTGPSQRRIRDARLIASAFRVGDVTSAQFRQFECGGRRLVGTAASRGGKRHAAGGRRYSRLSGCWW